MTLVKNIIIALLVQKIDKIFSYSDELSQYNNLGNLPGNCITETFASSIQREILGKTAGLKLVNCIRRDDGILQVQLYLKFCPCSFHVICSYYSIVLNVSPTKNNGAQSICFHSK